MVLLARPVVNVFLQTVVPLGATSGMCKSVEVQLSLGHLLLCEAILLVCPAVEEETVGVVALESFDEVVAVLGRSIAGSMNERKLKLEKTHFNSL